MYHSIAPRFWGSIGIASALALTLLPLMPKSAQAAAFPFTAGVVDSYSTTNGFEPSSPSIGAAKWLNNLLNSNNPSLSCPNHPRCLIRNFDENVYDRDFLHTFFFPNFIGKITGASLEIRVKAVGSSSNDQIALGFIDPSSGVKDPTNAWNRFFGNSDGVPGLLNTFWTSGLNHTFNFNLANLIPYPGHAGQSSNLISALNTKGFFDVYVQDDTNVDYVKLTLQDNTGLYSTVPIFTNPTFTSLSVSAVPEPLTIIGSATALGFGAFFKRQQGKNQKKNNV